MSRPDRLPRPRAIDEEIGVAVWSEGGKLGRRRRGVPAALKLTLSEAMAVVLSARLMVRYADKYDPDLAAAFEKLEEVLPAALAEHVERTLDVLSRRPRDEVFSDHVHLLTKAWAERRVVDDRVRAGHLRAGGGRPRGHRAPVPHRAVAPDACPLSHRLGRDARRAADVQDRADPRCRIDAADLRTTRGRDARDEPRAARGTSSRTRSSPTSCCASARPSRLACSRRRGIRPSAPETADDGSLIWRATVAGPIEIRLWILSWGDDVEVLEPDALRDDVAATHRRAAERYADRGGAAS